MRQIPNVLTALRILLALVFPVLLFLVSPLAALFVLLAAGVTDVADGFLARRYGWITDLGKVLDPIADKLTECVTLVCLAAMRALPILLVIPVFLKEAAQGVLALVMYRRRCVIAVSRWFGKLAVTLFYAAVAFSLFTEYYYGEKFRMAAAVVFAVALAGMIAAFLAYLALYLKLAARIKSERKGSVPEDATR